ncbi:FecR protein [Rhodopirellula maiorica SM1]|uniref:FecR protein n=1 Tax=Rhodopirellula maiorica SM1 TaxID=1265738 RepID=M5RPH6_9BACT|nr:FecR domain-containing protein [Rhodopirellula maiorica]EMI15854.1 FecR protein [Rhodopirellula maiorica SM1]
MSAKNNDDRLLLALLAKLVDDSITESEHVELQNLLRDDANAQRTYFNYLDLDTDLRQMTHGATTSPPNPQPKTSLRIRVAIAVAASLVMMVSFAWWRHRDQIEAVSASPAEEVVLVQSAGGVFFRDVMPAVGESLKSNHEYALTSGMIELQFPSGAEVILDAPAAIEIASLDRLIVRQGSCSVHAPPGAEGFQVITPKTEVTDLGTRFSVDVDEAGDTEVQVVEGAAEVLRRDQSAAEKVLLTQRQASRFDGGDSSSSVAYQPHKYRHQLPDRVVKFSMGMTNGKTNGQLRHVSVQRGGVTRQYDVTKMIPSEVTYFHGGSNTQHMSVPVGTTTEAGDGRRSVIESDALLHTGFLNLGGSVESLFDDPVLVNKQDDDDPDGDLQDGDTTLGMAIRFRTPVINAPGPDIVFFELQSALNPADGDGFHVGPLQFNAGLRSLSVKRYDITLHSAEALPIPDFDLLEFNSPVQSVFELINGSFSRLNPAIPFWAIAVGIDLSDLGYAPGTAVEGLFFQDAADDDHIVDPVFIAGLPDDLNTSQGQTP